MLRQGRAEFFLVSHNADVTKFTVLDSYNVNGADVFITEDGQYLVVEPILTSEAHSTYREMMGQLFYSLDPLSKSDDPVSYIEQHMWREAEDMAIVDSFSKYFQSLKYYLVRDVIGYGILDVLMKDDDVEEVTAERFDTKVGVIHRRFTEFNILDTNISFDSAGSMNSYIQRLVQRSGNSVTAAVPVMDAMTKEGDRITVTYGHEVSLPGPTIEIRKFTRQPFTISHVLAFGTLSRIMAAYHWMLFDAKAFGLIVGETGSGKTTLLNALAGLSNPRWKILTIEETPELKMPHYRWERLVTRTSPMITHSRYDVSIMDLIRASLRMRPDIEIVGEVRGREAQFLFQSAATGHGGLSTIHGASAEAALNRLASDPINIKASQQMLLWFVMHITRLKGQDNKFCRKVVSIKEVVSGIDSVSLHDLFTYDRKAYTYNIVSPEDLVRNSRKVHDAARILNVEPREDIEKRLDILTECMEKKSHREVFSIISRYYS